MERREKEKIEELKEATAAKLPELGRPQQGERVEDEVFRVGTDDTQPWPSDDEVRAILSKQPRAGGPVYGTHFAIRFTLEQMLPAPLLLGDPLGDDAQANIRADNPFASCITASSIAPFVMQEPVGSIAGGGFPLGVRKSTQGSAKGKPGGGRAGQFNN